VQAVGLSEMKTSIQRSRASESERLTEIAHSAKRHWGYPERWIELWRDTLTITPEFISKYEVYSAHDGEDILGFYALIIRGDKATLDHLWIDPKYIGAGLGKELFNHAVERAAELQASTLEVESDPNAEGFYKHMGARRIGETRSELEGKERILPLLTLEIKTKDLAV
jgi:GNAT superfamily N-acetyltransferase